MKPYVEVIVTVYNGKKYFRRCMNSLLDQTYENYGILIIDDGSTDGTGNMCDEYAKTTCNVRVIHTENNGLSVARNTGTRNTKAEFVVYVDSDDYVAKHMLEDMVEAAIGAQADISIIRSVAVGDERRSLCESSDKPSRTIIMSPEEALYDMCIMKHYGSSACGKLIKRELAERFEFPRGVLYEDLATVYKMIGGAQRVIYYDRIDYYYTQHQGEGITRSRSLRGREDIAASLIRMREYLEENYPSIRDCIFFQTAYAYFVFTKSLCAYSKADREEYRVIREKMRRNLFRREVVWNSGIRLRLKLQIAVASMGYIPMVLSWRLYYRLVGLRRL